MNEAFTGGCACGAIRYEIPGEPIFSNDCQCRDCQRKSGTGHGSYLTFPGKRSVKLEGEAKHWDMVGDSGMLRHAPLPDLRVTGVQTSGPGRPVHRARGSLDDPSRYSRRR